MVSHSRLSTSPTTTSALPLSPHTPSPKISSVVPSVRTGFGLLLLRKIWRSKMSQPKYVCIHCHCPVYYSWGAKAWAHEGDRPSKMVVHNEAVEMRVAT